MEKIKNVFKDLILFFASRKEQREERKKRQSSREFWGKKRQQSQSGVEWYLPRFINLYRSDTASKPDSKFFLERLGFKILGIQCKDMYIVEPPEQWTKELNNPSGEIIKDADGLIAFKTFGSSGTLESACYIMAKN